MIHAAILLLIGARNCDNNVWQRKMHFMDLFAIVLGKEDTATVFINKVRFFSLSVFFWASYLRNELGDPHFFFSFLT